MIQKPNNIYVERIDEVKSNNIVANNATSAISANDNYNFIPQSVFDNLPPLLKDACNLFKDKYEKDVFLHGALAVLGGSFHRLFAFDDVNKKKVAANLLSFIVAPPASGKGALNYSKRLMEEIKVSFTNQSKKLGVKTKSQLPIPANNSSSGLIDMLNQNEGVGVMIESEIDTLVNATKQDWGNYSDVLRYAFENESCSLNRKGEKEPVEIKNIKLSVAMSGTPNQFKALMYSAENGLFSRGCYYVFRNDESKLNFLDRINSQIDIDEQFAILAKKANEFYELHLSQQSIKVIFSEEQLTKIQDALNKEFSEIITTEDLRANVIRSYKIVQKVAAILALIDECEKGILFDQIPCSEKVLQTALEFTLTSLKHSYKAYELLNKKTSLHLPNSQQKLFDSLADEFTRSEAVGKGKSFGIAERTIDYCIKTYKKKGLIAETGHGKFKKTA